MEFVEVGNEFCWDLEKERQFGSLSFKRKILERFEVV
jgi:hypothetical protein